MPEGAESSLKLCVLRLGFDADIDEDEDFSKYNLAINAGTYPSGNYGRKAPKTSEFCGIENTRFSRVKRIFEG